MIELVLKRYSFTGTETMGLLYGNGKYICDTLELPWKGNYKDLSCIPHGTYPLEVYYSTSHKEKRIRVSNVSGRSNIAIHVANKTSELLGCIAPGTKYGNQVFHSRQAMQTLLSLLEKEKGILQVTPI